MTGSRKTAYQYDHRDRMRQRTVSQWNGSSWQALYSETFTYDGWLPVRQVRVGVSGVVTNHYLWGLDLAGQRTGRSGQQAGGIGGLLAIRVERSGTSTLYLPVADQVGNIRSVINAATLAVVAWFSYAPCGQVQQTWCPDPQVRADLECASFRFQSKILDPDTGLVYFGYRWYNPSLQKWMSRDPLGEAGGVNLTEVLGRDGVNNVDPHGLDWYKSTDPKDKRQYWFNSTDKTLDVDNQKYTWTGTTLKQKTRMLLAYGYNLPSAGIENKNDWIWKKDAVSAEDAPDGLLEVWMRVQVSADGTPTLHTMVHRTDDWATWDKAFEKQEDLWTKLGKPARFTKGGWRTAQKDGTLGHYIETWADYFAGSGVDRVIMVAKGDDIKTGKNADWKDAKSGGIWSAHWSSTDKTDGLFKDEASDRSSNLVLAPLSIPAKAKTPIDFTLFSNRIDYNRGTTLGRQRISILKTSKGTALVADPIVLGEQIPWEVLTEFWGSSYLNAERFRYLYDRK